MSADRQQSHKSAEERRQFPRVETHLMGTTKVTSTGAEGYGRIVNLSMGGAYILTSDPLDTKEEIELRFQVPDSGYKMTVRSRVCRVVPGEGMGLQFISLKEAQKMALEKYVRKLFYGGSGFVLQ